MLIAKQYCSTQIYGQEPFEILVLELYPNRQARLEEGEVSHEISIIFLSQKMSVILDFNLIVLARVPLLFVTCIYN